MQNRLFAGESVRIGPFSWLFLLGEGGLGVDSIKQYEQASRGGGGTPIHKLCIYTGMCRGIGYGF